MDCKMSSFYFLFALVYMTKILFMHLNSTLLTLLQLDCVSAELLHCSFIIADVILQMCLSDSLSFLENLATG